jgi:hypothetical protein
VRIGGVTLPLADVQVLHRSGHEPVRSAGA